MKSNGKKKQHFVPQSYLKGFSSDKNTIYRYDITNDSSKRVPIKSVCYEKYLYEIKDNNGNFINFNYLEEYLSILENRFNVVKQNINSQLLLRIDRNIEIKQNDELLLKIFICTQVMRDPELIEIAKKTIIELSKNNIDENSANTMVIMELLPFMNKISEESKNQFLLFLQPFLNMSCHIFADNKKRIPTSNKPVIIYNDSGSLDRYDEVIFPLSSSLVLFLDNEKTESKVTTLSDLQLIAIFQNIAYSRATSIYTQNEMSDVIKEIVRSERKDIKNTTINWKL